jgi:cellulose synthase/poly-beta-1,6-N-acetylglucosamine synthase-like glycosyltransferase
MRSTARHARADWSAQPLAPGTPRVLVLIPAHNEAGCIEDTLVSLRAQDRAPDSVVVVCDNCTDDTALLAERRGAEVFTTVNNAAKKAGALNQALAEMLPLLGDEDVVLVMDADTELDPDFIENGLGYLELGYAAVGGTFRGRAGGGLVGMFQRNEYARYQRDVTRRRGKALVLTGTATLFRVRALREVVEARRRGDLPGAATVYDTTVLTEDNELTLALLHRGMPIIAPSGCTMITEVMTTWGDLARQRLRWKRGALENLQTYGFTSITRQYWVRQALAAVGVLVIGTYLTVLALSLLTQGTLHTHPVWLAISAIFAVERAISVRSRGPAQMVVGALVLIEFCYDVFLQLVQARAFLAVVTKRQATW